MSPARQGFTGKQPALDVLSRRRVVGQALRTGVAATLAGSGTPRVVAAQEATPVVDTGASTIETVSGQAVYTLPRDHRWHGGPFYETSAYWEWHYWTAFATDVDTGEDWGLFYTTMRHAFNPATGEPSVLNYLSLTNFATGAFHPSARAATAGGERAGLPVDSASPDDFAYGIDSGDGLSLVERYYHLDERWGFQVASAAVAEQAALEIDVELVLEAPGYLPTTPTGIEEEGYSRDGLYNPETMYGLSYYYYAPALALTGTITAGDETHRVEGSAWLEHQWGNFSTAAPESYRWRSGSVRFTEGGGINWRQWVRGPDNAPVHDLNHYAIHTPEGAVSYGYGRELTYEILDMWVSPHTGRRYGLYGLLRTPVGTFYVSPPVADQEIVVPGLTAPLWEGALV
ncbi:MAG: lipocalin-like domain-containing protein, partial [Dehalococcoidia bacterium]